MNEQQKEVKRYRFDDEYMQEKVSHQECLQCRMEVSGGSSRAFSLACYVLILSIFNIVLSSGILIAIILIVKNLK